MDFTSLPEWAQASIPYLTYGTLVFVAALSVWALVTKVFKAVHHDKTDE